MSFDSSGPPHDSTPHEEWPAASRVHVELTDQPIHAANYLDRIADDDVGAHLWFHGVTRRRTATEAAKTEPGNPSGIVGSNDSPEENFQLGNKPQDRNKAQPFVETRSLCYEAYRPMAVDQLRQIGRQAVTEFSLTGLVVVHRLGVVPVRESSVLLGCSSPHRVACFSAIAWFMDRLKIDVPIWKREQFTDGTEVWQHPETPSIQSTDARHDRSIRPPRKTSGTSDHRPGGE